MKKQSGIRMAWLLVAGVAGVVAALPLGCATSSKTNTSTPVPTSTTASTSTPVPPTSTPQNTGTFTYTATFVNTSTSTSTRTPSGTSTVSGTTTATATISSTSTVTNTWPVGFSPSLTSTNTFSPIPTSTYTFPPPPSWTATSNFTNTITLTPSLTLTPANTFTPVPTLPTGTLAVTVQDQEGTPIAGAIVMLNSNTAGALTSNASGVVNFSSVTFPVNVHIFSPNVSGTPSYSPDISTIAGVNSSTLTYGLIQANTSGMGLMGTFTGYVNGSDMVQVRASDPFNIGGGGGGWNGAASGSYTFCCTNHPVVDLAAIEFNTSPTPSPVAAAFIVGYQVTPGPTNVVNIALTPIAGFSTGSTTVNMTYNGNFSYYQADSAAGSAANTTVDTEQVQAGCSANCALNLSWVYPAAWSNYKITVQAGSSGGGGNNNGSGSIYRSSSIPGTQAATFLDPGTIIANPSNSVPTLSFSNASSAGAQAHYQAGPTSGNNNKGAWEVVAPGIASGTSGSVAYPASYPSGVPSTYGLQVGTMYQGQLNMFILSGTFTPSNLSNANISALMQQFTQSGSNFTY